jgi:hypothetical protein
VAAELEPFPISGDDPTDTPGAAAPDIADSSSVSVTVTRALPLFPSLVADTVACPGRSPVTSPVELTMATAGLLLFHVTARSVRTVPSAALSVAVSCRDSPVRRFTAAGFTATVATGAGGGADTVTAAPPLFPSLVAVTVA